MDQFGNTDWNGPNPFADDPEPEAAVEVTPEGDTVVDVEAPAEVAVTAETDSAEDTQDEIAKAEAEAETPPETETEKAEEARKFAGKYASVEDLEAAYRNTSGEATRMSQDLAAARQQAAELQAFVDKAKPIIEREYAAAQNQVPQVPEGFEFGDPQAVAQFVQQQNQQTQQQMQAQFAEQQKVMQESQAQAAAQAELSRFYQAHPAAAPGQPVYDEVVRVATQYNEYLPRGSEGLEIAHTLATNPQVKQLVDRLEVVPDRDAISRAQEVVSDPNLLRWVAANPSSFEADDQAWEDVKVYASLPSMLQATQQGAQSAQQEATERAKQAAFVETGSGGQPVQAAPGARPGEETFADVVKFWQEQNQVLGPAPQ